jgi:endonuclease/exonuclease/phosphatase (EEP) superfamily protein YafD
VKSLISALAFLLRLGAFVLALAAAVAAVAAQGGRFSDRLDALTHFAPIWLILGAAALALWVLAGGRSFLRLTPLTAAVAILAAGGLMVPELSRHKSGRPPAEGETLKLVQFNLWAENSDPEGTARWILSEDPDIVTIEEGYSVKDGVADMLSSRYPYRTTCVDPAPCSAMILSKRKPVYRHGMGAAVSKAMLIGAVARFNTPRGDFTVLNVHYTWPIPAGPQQQQSLRLTKVLDGIDRDSAILAGDFNSTPWSFSMQRQDRRFGMERRTRGQATWPAAPVTSLHIRPPFPLLAIDQVYAGRQWKTVSVKRGPRLGSDHYPVIVVLRR